MENEDIGIMVAENQIKIDFDAIDVDQTIEESPFTSTLIKAVNFDWIKEEVLFVVVKAYHNDVVKDMPNLSICGKKMLDWVVNAGSGCETKIIEDTPNIIERVRGINTDKKIIAVFYSDTPLLNKVSFNKFCEYFSSRNMNFLKLSRGFLVKTEFLRSNYSIAQGSSELDDKCLIIMDSAKAINYASSLIYNKIISYHIKNGVIIYGQNTVFIDADVEIENGVVIYPNNIIKGQSIIAENVVLESGNIIKDSIISPNVKLSCCYIENSKVNSGNRIEPFSKIIGQELS